MAFFARKIVEDNGNTRYQTVDEHNQNTAKLAEMFASAFGMEKSGYLSGIMHDIGKCSPEFQNRLLNNGKIVDHSAPGAYELVMSKCFVEAIAAGSHHTGLPDIGTVSDTEKCPTFYGRLRKEMVKYVFSSKEILKSRIDVRKYSLLELSFLIRILCSCVIDADRLDAESFSNNGLKNRGDYDSLEDIYKKLGGYVSAFDNAPNTELNLVRKKILSECKENGKKERGMYTLTVPTGGGKTLSSLMFAVRHALANHMDRIIYVIPFTTVIDQSADVFKKAVGEKNVLEHHSSYEPSGVTQDDIDKINHAMENWDVPIVVTTAVEFFETMYASSAHKCRKLHNVANSVVIFDEAQTIQVNYLEPCVAAMSALTKLYHSTVVMCTATQPYICDLLRKYDQNVNIQEICHLSEDEIRVFDRVSYRFIGAVNDAAIIHQLSEKEQVLCIVNTRATAKDYFMKLPSNGRYHLSTNMCPAHRKKVLEEIRERLIHHLPCRVISTSLIEAGVDIDFPFVYRELSGMDSVVQSAGRCNREGRLSKEESIVTVFERFAPVLPLFACQVSASKEALVLSKNTLSLQTVNRYFKSLRSFIGNNTDIKHIIDILKKGNNGVMLPFKTVSRLFKLIDQDSFTLYIPYGEGDKLTKELSKGECSRDLLRKLGQYSVNVYDKQHNMLLNSGKITVCENGMEILNDMSIYDSQCGLIS